MKSFFALLRGGVISERRSSLSHEDTWWDMQAGKCDTDGRIREG